MIAVSRFRIGNYASFDGLLQRIESQIGLDHSAFLEPLAVTVSNFKLIGFTHHFESDNYLIYFFDTREGDGISIIFRSESDFVIMEKISRIEYPFLKWIHEVQNLIEDKTIQTETVENSVKRTIVIA